MVVKPLVAGDCLQNCVLQLLYFLAELLLLDCGPGNLELRLERALQEADFVSKFDVFFHIIIKIKLFDYHSKK